MVNETWLTKDLENTLRGLGSAVDAGRSDVEDVVQQAFAKGFHEGLLSVALSYGIELKREATDDRTAS